MVQGGTRGLQDERVPWAILEPLLAVLSFLIVKDLGLRVLGFRALGLRVLGLRV